ncbi:MAG: uracil-DNA glycosylase [Firmicutes bacterium]|nr:uracil-DNA glycosylase [Bacillota bacterium]
MEKFLNGWDEILGPEFEKEYYKSLRQFLKSEYSSYIIYPNMHDIFNCFRLCPYNDVKVVILGQDPYVQKGQAHGFCFSVKENIPLPGSLQNIYKELAADVNFVKTNSGDLTAWAKQGVLLLNTVLTVREATPGSHRRKGWEILTDAVISALNSHKSPVVFLLWGNDAKTKKSLITNQNNLILESAHPSPLSCTGFFGCKHFSKANEFLKNNELTPINWQI